MATISVTRDQAVQILAKWAGCVDALGLAMALERIGAVKFEKPKREQLLDRAAKFCRPDSMIEVSNNSAAEMGQLINEMAEELKKCT